MFEDYSFCVRNYYQKKKSEDCLHSNLIRPTPAKIKNECISLCDSRDLKKDEKFLSEFFGSHANASAYQKAIRHNEADRFKPLCNFLQGKNNNTSEKNIELLAWLIDFPARPYRAGWTPPQDNNTNFSEDTSRGRVGSEVDPGENLLNPGISNTRDNLEGTTKSEKRENENLKRQEERVQRRDNGPNKHRRVVKIFKNRINIILPLGLVLICGLGYTIYTPSEPVECMYWTGDHYAPISCTRKISAKAVIALDTMKAAHFRKITTPDTITLNSLGHVWYSKINGKVEFFTSDGVNPEHPEKELKHATRYMIKKYGKQ